MSAFKTRLIFSIRLRAALEPVWFDVSPKGCVDAKAFAPTRLGLLYNRKNLFSHSTGVELGHERLKTTTTSLRRRRVRRRDGKRLSGLGLHSEERIEFLLHALRRRARSRTMRARGRRSLPRRCRQRTPCECRRTRRSAGRRRWASERRLESRHARGTHGGRRDRFQGASGTR